MAVPSRQPGTRVLAIASHVVSGYVGNTCATLVMQFLGCNVSALNTVQLSNHTAYRGVSKGPKTSADDLLEIYDGLKQNFLNDYTAALTGFAPGTESVKAIRTIIRDLKLSNTTRPGAFFWFLDPVMGDDQKLYVSEDVPPIYRNIMRDADMILPNQFELEILSEQRVDSISSLLEAVSSLHVVAQVPHILVTSVKVATDDQHLLLVGSSMKSDSTARPFKIEFPHLNCAFNGSGDLLAALMVVNFRQEAEKEGLLSTRSWMSPDEVPALELPLMRAARKALACTQSILRETVQARDLELGDLKEVMEREQESEKRINVRRTRAAELRIVENLDQLKGTTPVFEAVAL